MNKNEDVKMKVAKKSFNRELKRQFNLKNIPFIRVISFFLLLNVISVILIIIFSKYLPPQVPLNYGLPRGERQLTQPTLLILPVLLSSFFILLNSVFSLIIKPSFLKNVLIISGVFVSVLSLITVIRIIMTIEGLS